MKTMISWEDITLMFNNKRINTTQQNSYSYDSEELMATVKYVCTVKRCYIDINCEFFLKTNLAVNEFVKSEVYRTSRTWFYIGGKNSSLLLCL